MELLTYSIDNRGNKPVYIYLYECIKKDIHSGVIKPGEKLPSKRSLSNHLGVAVITIENAYAQLETEGYVKGIEKKGYFVSEDIEDIFVEHLGVQNSERTDSVIDNISDEESIFADFTSSSILADSFPFDSWARLMRRSLLDRESSFLQAPEGQGIVELREAIATYLYKSKGMIVEPSRIVIGPGTEYLHHILIQLLGRSFMVAVEDPGYKKVGLIYETNGIKVLHIPVDEEGMRIEKLKDSNVKLVHISPSHHFPTGSIMPANRRGRLVNWAKKQEAYIIEDDYDSEFRFEGRPLSTIYSIDNTKVIYMNTFTKTLAPSIRIAYMVLPENLYIKYREKLGFYSGTVSGFEQYTLAEFISEGYYERHIRRVRNKYKGYRDNLLDAIEKANISDKIEILEDKAGLQLVFAIKGKMDVTTEEYIARLKKSGVKINSVSTYCYSERKKYENVFLINYCDMEKKDLIKALKIIVQINENYSEN